MFFLQFIYLQGEGRGITCMISEEEGFVHLLHRDLHPFLSLRGMNT